MGDLAKKDVPIQFVKDDQVTESSLRDVQDSVHACRTVQLSIHLKVHTMILPCRVVSTTGNGVVNTYWTVVDVVAGAVVVGNVVVIGVVVSRSASPNVRGGAGASEGKEGSQYSSSVRSMIGRLASEGGLAHTTLSGLFSMSWRGLALWGFVWT